MHEDTEAILKAIKGLQTEVVRLQKFEFEILQELKRVNK